MRYPASWVKCRILTFMMWNKQHPKHKPIHNKQRLSTSGIGQPVPEKGRPPQAIPSSISRYIIIFYVRYQGSKYTVIHIYTRTNYHKRPSQTRGRQEETHCPSHRFRCLLLYLLWRDRQLCRHHGSRSAPILHGRAVDTRQSQRQQTSFGTYCRPNIPWWVCRQVYTQ